jgi:hypothetical protein
MAIATREWIDLIESEYLRDFVTDGGAGVKFAGAMLINWRPLAECWLSCPSGTR